MKHIEVLFTPAEFDALKNRDLSQTLCVVFDVLRATTTMVSALDAGAEAILPVRDIREALEERRRRPQVLLAGERDGVRIEAKLTGSVPFDLGNSPREFTREKVFGRTIVITTTNGTRALRACVHAGAVLACSFVNLSATWRFIQAQNPSEVLLVCSGTFEEAAYEDVLAAGACCQLLREHFPAAAMADSALLAMRLYGLGERDLPGALSQSRNGRRLLSRPELRDDVAFCARRDVLDLVAAQGPDGLLRKV